VCCSLFVGGIFPLVYLLFQGRGERHIRHERMLELGRRGFIHDLARHTMHGPTSCMSWINYLFVYLWTNLRVSQDRLWWMYNGKIRSIQSTEIGQPLVPLNTICSRVTSVEFAYNYKVNPSILDLVIHVKMYQGTL
jgi:hypothetical protein